MRKRLTAGSAILSSDQPTNSCFPPIKCAGMSLFLRAKKETLGLAALARSSYAATRNDSSKSISAASSAAGSDQTGSGLPGKGDPEVEHGAPGIPGAPSDVERGCPEKVLPANPCAGVEFPVRVKGLFRPHYVAWSEQRTIEAHAPEYLRNIVSLITETGLRVYKETDADEKRATRSHERDGLDSGFEDSERSRRSAADATGTRSVPRSDAIVTV